jgi:hypothetical protein
MQAITKSDLLTIIEDVGFGSAVVAGADRNGIVVDGYLNLASIAERLDKLVQTRLRHRRLRDNASEVPSAHGPESDRVTLGLDARNAVLPGVPSFASHHISDLGSAASMKRSQEVPALRRNRNLHADASDRPKTSTKCGLSRCQPIPTPSSYSVHRT